MKSNKIYFTILKIIVILIQCIDAIEKNISDITLLQNETSFTLNNTSKIVDTITELNITTDRSNIIDTSISRSIFRSNATEIYLIKFDFLVDEFIDFDPKNSMSEMNAKVKLKYWNEYNKSIYQQQIRPKIEFFDNDVLVKTSNQFYSENIQQRIEPEDYFNQIIGNLYDKNSSNKQVSIFEENLNLKFKCRTENSIKYIKNEELGLDASRFPFDTHICNLYMDLDPLPANKSIPQKNILFLFSLETVNEILEYNKLVKKKNNYSWILREWVLKGVETVNVNMEFPYTETMFNQDLLFKSVFIKRSLNNSINLQYQKKEINEAYDSNLEFQTWSNELIPAKFNFKFIISRRSELLIFIYVVPLLIFTTITFLIFFMPTTENSEKTLVAIFNFLIILIFNLFLFKVLIHDYELLQMPFILQYSNCLMIIQMGVIAYTCMVKSIYHYGFLTFNRSLVSNLAKNAYKEIFYINSNFIYDKINSETFDRNARKNYDQVKAENKLFYIDSVKIKSPILKLDHSQLDKTVSTFLNEESHLSESVNMRQHATTSSQIYGFQSEESDMNFSSNEKCPDEVLILESRKNKTLNDVERKTNNRNRVFEKFCCGSNLGNTSPVSVFENFRPVNIKKKIAKCYTDSINLTNSNSDFDFLSHLSRRNNQMVNLKKATNDIDKEVIISNMQSSLLSKNAEIIDFSKLGESIYKEKINENCPRPSANSIGSNFNKVKENSSVEMSKLNINLSKLVKMQEIYVKEKIVREEWKRKARIFDGICCLIVFFLLITCSSLIFFILPYLKASQII